ncbi:hypothetical protein [Actinoplanes sp. NPDC049802]|uniref:hypothetical protein n=1 Tax=Actinoplanes sp. NPDC049802 TaxID=3154742 RepID=UPI0033FE07D7
MSLWRSIRGEMAGAWRSVCYDLSRRTGATDPRPDVTSTGMSTFPGSLVDVPDGPPDTNARPPRRFVAVTAFCALGLAGAAGSYLVATTTFAGRMSDRAATPPAVAAPLPAETAEQGGVAGMGAVPAARERRAGATGPVPTAPPAGRAVKPPASAAAGAAAAPAAPRPPAVERTTAPGCDCATPPVPTPTAAPSETSASPSTDPDISASPSPSGSVSPSPDISPSTADSDHPVHRHHRRWR